MPLFKYYFFCKNHPTKIILDLDENETVGETRFPINGFTRRLVLTQRQKATRKWSFSSDESDTTNNDTFLKLPLGKRVKQRFVIRCWKFR